MSDFAGKTVIVTGAAGTLGSAVASAFESAGAAVGRLDVVEQAGITHCDLFDPASCAAAVAAVIDAHGAVDVLANVAGGFAMGDPVHATPADTWDLMLKLNAGSIVNMARAVVPGMLENGGGSIVNVAARAGLAGAATMGAYVASKSAVMRLTETMAEELKASRINVNCVMPSLIDTPPNRAAMPDADFSEWVAPESIAGVMLFLASSAARDVHGAAVPVVGLS